MDRVFLDANVLFSAAYRESNGLLELWQLTEVELITSRFAIDEANRNLDAGDRRQRLSSLLRLTSIVDEPAAEAALPDAMALPEKDIPIFLAAIQARATHLLTGDKTHFGQYYGQTIGGVLVQPPADYLMTRLPQP